MKKEDLFILKEILAIIKQRATQEIKSSHQKVTQVIHNTIKKYQKDNKNSLTLEQGKFFDFILRLEWTPDTLENSLETFYVYKGIKFDPTISTQLQFLK
jgi:hypothetical protein